MAVVYIVERTYAIEGEVAYTRLRDAIISAREEAEERGAEVVVWKVVTAKLPTRRLVTAIFNREGWVHERIEVKRVRGKQEAE